MNSDIKACAVISENGEIIQMLQTNEKGYRKSIENNQLWAVNPETGRLLPVDVESQITGFREKNGWYEVVVKAETEEDSESKNESVRIISGDIPASASAIIERLYKLIKQRKEESEKKFFLFI